MIGQSISHYRILRRLGAGGMSELYEAEDTDLHRKVAVKILPEALAAKPETRERFKREARALAALNHPNIVTIYSVEQSDQTHFLTMELVEGRPLSDLIPPGGFDAKKIFALAIPLTEALVAAHARGIGHRDLKPSNVMVTDQGRVKVIDFGLAKLFQADTGALDLDAPTVHQTVQGQILGTPAYMSPEQIEGRELDLRTDIFSLGILLCEMATNRRPFAGDNLISVMSSILRDPPTPVAELKPGLPEHLGRIIRRCLQKDPSERYQSALEVRNELKGLAEETRTAQRSPLTAPGESQARFTDVSTPRRIEPPLPPNRNSEFQPLAALSIRANNLPVQLTSFIGRARELAEVTRLMASGSDGTNEIRLLTLTGPGGTGKTRLALQVAAGLLKRFSEGVWLVELAALSDPSLVPKTLASAIGLHDESGRPSLELLTLYLATKQALLLLDNCEHLVAACAELSEALLRACPRLQILATSREALRVTGETTWAVPSLSVPSLAGEPAGRIDLCALEQYESIKLFVERAKAVTPAFELNSQNSRAVAQLCHRLDGIPLAIELAAARTRLLPVEQLLERVQDRFRLLTGGSRTALPRQQTLRALVDWSYDLLSSQERLLFNRLSVFAGGWTLEAAEAVCADVREVEKVGQQGPTELLYPEAILELLGNLLEKSMVVGESFADHTARYRLLETLRQYAQERLATDGESAIEALRARHTMYFVGLAEQVALGMRGPDQVKWSNRFEIEHDNLRAALEWGKAPDAPLDRVESVLRLAAPLYAPWFRRGHGREGRQHFEALLAHPNAQRPTRARARVLFAAGSLALWQDGDDATAWALLNESLSLGEHLVDQRVMADARHNLGMVHFNRRDYAAARHHHEEALKLSQAAADVYGIRWALEDLAELAEVEGNTDLAGELYDQALSLARKAGDHHSIGIILQSMGASARSRGKHQRARELIGEGLTIMQQIGCKHCSARCLVELAFVASASGEPERAVRFLGAADTLRKRTGIMVPKASVGTIEQTLGEARRQLSDAAYATAWAEGRTMSLPQSPAGASYG